MNVAMLLCETGIPQSGVLAVLPGEIRCLFDLMAEARRTDHRAIRTCQTSCRHIVPVLMLMRLVKGLRQARAFQSADLALCTSIYPHGSLTGQFLRSWRQGDGRKQIRSGFAPCFDQQLIVHFSQNEIKTVLSTGTRVHGCAKAGLQCPGTVYSNNEQPPTASRVVGVLILAL